MYTKEGILPVNQKFCYVYCYMFLLYKPVYTVSEVCILWFSFLLGKRNTGHKKIKQRNWLLIWRLNTQWYLIWLSNIQKSFVSRADKRLSFSLYVHNSHLWNCLKVWHIRGCRWNTKYTALYDLTVLPHIVYTFFPWTYFYSVASFSKACKILYHKKIHLQRVKLCNIMFF